MKRRGEMGRLYQPVTQLTRAEILLYGEVFRIAGDHPEIEDTRDGFLRLLQMAADATIGDPDARKVMVAHVTALADEIAQISDDLTAAGKVPRP